LPNGEYLYGFTIIDLAQNETYSDFIEITIEDEDETEIYVSINGLDQDYEQPPVLLNGNTMVPLRAIFEALDAKVSWNDQTKTVTATRGKTIIILPIGAKSAKVNGVVKPLQAPGQIINGSTMVPVRFVSEALGAKVTWDPETRTVVIKTQ